MTIYVDWNHQLNDVAGGIPGGWPGLVIVFGMFLYWMVGVFFTMNSGLEVKKGVNITMKRKIGIFAVLSTFLLSLCLLGCQHGDSGATTPPIHVAPSAAAMDLKKQGDDYWEQGDRSQAISAYTAALASSPQYAEAYCARGLPYTTMGQYDRAIADYTAALRINPQYAEAYYGRGYAHAKKNQWDQAIADYTEALRINPQYAKAYSDRGWAYCHGKNQPEQGLADYNEALRINPQDSYTYFLKGLECKRLGRKTEAIEAYRQALRYESDASDKASIQESISELTAQ